MTQALRARYGNDLPEIGEAWNGVLANLLAHRRRLASLRCRRTLRQMRTLQAWVSCIHLSGLGLSEAGQAVITIQPTYESSHLSPLPRQAAWGFYTVPRASSPGGAGSANLFGEFNKAEGGDIWFALDNTRPRACFAGAQAEAASPWQRISSNPVRLQAGLDHFENVGQARFKFCFLTLGRANIRPCGRCHRARR